jgi:hypothetical protein
MGLLVGALSAPPLLFAASNRDLSEGFPLEDAVLIPGRQMPSLEGAELSSLVLAAVRDGELRAIPFQVDEVRDGQHVFEWVSPLGREKGLSDRDVDHGRLDADDELTFMAWDLGARRGSILDLRSASGVELAVTDPLSGRTGYAYLLANPNLTKSPIDYVKLEVVAPRYQVSTPRYHYSSLAARGFFDNLRLATASAGWTPNLVLRNRTPGHAKLRFVGFGADFDFYDLIRGENIARKDGVVRVLWRCAGGADFGVLQVKAKGSTEQVFYANRMDQPVVMDLPFNFDSVLQSFEISGTLVLNPPALPLTYFDVENPAGVRIDGQPKAGAGPRIGKVPRDWCVLSAPEASFYFLILFSEAWKLKLNPVSYVEDAPERSEVGSQFGDLVHLLTKGRQEYMVRYYLIPEEFRWGQEKRIPEIAGRPLQVVVRPLP